MSDREGYLKRRDQLLMQDELIEEQQARIEELEAELAELRAHSELLREALTSISTALDAYGVRWCRDVAKDALLKERKE